MASSLIRRSPCHAVGSLSRECQSPIEAVRHVLKARGPANDLRRDEGRLCLCKATILTRSQDGSPGMRGGSGPRSWQLSPADRVSALATRLANRPYAKMTMIVAPSKTRTHAIEIANHRSSYRIADARQSATPSPGGNSKIPDDRGAVAAVCVCDTNQNNADF